MKIVVVGGECKLHLNVHVCIRTGSQTVLGVFPSQSRLRQTALWRMLCPCFADWGLSSFGTKVLSLCVRGSVTAQSLKRFRSFGQVTKSSGI